MIFVIFKLIPSSNTRPMLARRRITHKQTREEMKLGATFNQITIVSDTSFEYIDYKFLFLFFTNSSVLLVAFLIYFSVCAPRQPLTP